MKAIDPGPLIREAADELEPVRNEVVVVGAAAVEVALDGTANLLTPTRDVDVVVAVENVEAVVEHLEGANLQPSADEYERGFTWVRGNLKVQLIRGFHPFPKGVSRSLPQNSIVDTARAQEHREPISFSPDPGRPRLWVATPACLLALKQHAFGRTRMPGDVIVKRDYYDAYLLIAHAPEEVLRSYAQARGDVCQHVRKAVGQLAHDEDPVRRAGEEMVSLRAADNLRDAEAEIRLAARAFEERLSEKAQ